jgi:hypothetical protein
MDTTYPEHEKLKAVKDRSQTVGEFLDWLRDTKEFAVCELHPEERKRDPEWHPVRLRTEQLLAEFFEIDLDKLSAEKDAMVALLQEQASKRG